MTEKNFQEFTSGWHVSRRSVPVLNSMIDQGVIAEVGCSAFAVLVVLRRMASVGKTHVFPSQSVIGKYTGLSAPTVAKSLEKLESFGYIESVLSKKKTKTYALKERWLVESTDGDRKTIIESDYTPSKCIV